MAGSGTLSLKGVHTVLEGHAGDVNSTAWSPTSKEVFCSCCGDKHIRVWKIDGASKDKKLTPVETVLAHKFYINSCAYNPSGDLFATTSSDDTVKLWSTASWTCVGEWAWHSWVWHNGCAGECGPQLTDGEVGVGVVCRTCTLGEGVWSCGREC